MKPAGGRMPARNGLTDLRALLSAEEFASSLEKISRMPARRVVNTLFALLCSGDELLKGRAVTAMGVVVSRLADEDLELARVVMRRFMWSLNDESGGIGWGAPEAMGEIMARNARLASEYLHILLSYIRDDGNRLENELLERGVLWGIARVSLARPGMLAGAEKSILPFLHSPSPVERGLALKILARLGAMAPAEVIDPLIEDQERFSLYEDGQVTSVRVSDLAAELQRVSTPGHSGQAEAED